LDQYFTVFLNLRFLNFKFCPYVKHKYLVPTPLGILNLGFVLNGTHQIVVYADDVYILGRSIHTVKKNTEALVVASKDIGLEVNAKKLNTWSCLKIRMQAEVQYKA